MERGKIRQTIFRLYHVLLMLSCMIFLIALTGVGTCAQESTCCSSLNLSTLALEVPCIRVGEDRLSLSLSYSGGTLFKLENYALLDNSSCSSACCGDFDSETWLVSLPYVLVGESSLWTTFSLVANSEGLFFDLLGYGFNPPSPVAEIKQITLDTAQDSSSFFSFVTDNYADSNTFDVFAEPWCKPYISPRLCGHFVSLGNKALEDVTAADIPAAGALSADLNCENLAVGDTCIFKNADDSYTAATIANHVMPDDCTHRITLRYKSLSSSTGSCNVTEPQPTHEHGDILWTHDVVPVNNHTMYIADLPLAVGKDGSIYYSAAGGQDNLEPSRIYALNKTDGSLKWKTEPLAIWHVNSNIVVGDDGTVYVLSATKLYSIDPATGIFNWVWEVPHSMGDKNTYGEVSGLALANNGDLIFKTNGSGSYYRALYCVGSNGQTKWHHFIGADIAPITIGYGGTIYDFGYEMLRDANRQPYYLHYLYAYDPNTGNELWKIPTDAGVFSGSNNITVAANGDLIWRNNDKLVRSDPAEGHTIWQVDAESNYANKVIDPAGFIYLYDQWAGTAVFNPQTGAKKESRIHVTSWPVVDSLGHLCGATLNGLNVNDATGTLVWEKNIGFQGQTVTISADKVIYVADSHKVYAVQGDATMAQSGWPRFSHDNRNTFNVNKH